MATDAFTLALVALGIVVGAGAILFYITRRLRKRANQIRGDLTPSSRHRDDQAYNKIRLRRAEAEILKRQGYDVSVVSGRLDEADGRWERHDYDGALSLAATAHDTMVSMRRSAPQAGPSPGGPSRAASAATAAVPSTSAPRPNGLPTSGTSSPIDSSGGSARPKLEKNQAESRFQMSLLVEDLARVRAQSPSDPMVLTGERGLSDAQLAFTKAEYTESLKVALRTRRALGVAVEGLPSSSRGRAATPVAAETDDPDAKPRGEGSPGPVNCTRCGRPVRADDQFCRSCGAPRGSSACPRCGAPVTPEDVYCGACGAPTS